MLRSTKGRFREEPSPLASAKMNLAIKSTSRHLREFNRLGEDLRTIDRRRLEEIRGTVDVGGESDPVIRGTGVPVYVIAGLARGQTVEEILEDYPSLAREQVEGAIEYAKAYPKAGRPYPARSFKRMIGDLAQAGVWDVESDSDEARTPRLMP